ncbi:MAG: hypothetical protein US62_C0046G0001 [Candidatus Woesebacteria bacterium GW2011_GWA1_37_8]|uniref:Uncharacterized protein n=2 Tax=Candidatus Woeseibacteriota TaxID=1752722 RepID=A0A0G0PCG8_9BACT|nr:MAG: hypothetical protein US39_C0008G0015 [Microgenomates group bacterium GW2011_GWC1_37_12b]KKQ43602.1 MAG: hypothetical protein US62_C0046G0001 [Candidatus Woesebacteria bacterium GW2011_GWA1_37_8]KKQ86981.1 MAG: hypothetical protein UT10_C0013G0030 [Candidatus Woesebacteria bacterium GW2011_GWB1_38_8b]
MEIKNKECPFCSSVAFCMKNDIEGQATRGGLNEGSWARYITRLRTDVLPKCLDPEGLQAAIARGEELWKQQGH